MNENKTGEPSLGSLVKLASAWFFPPNSYLTLDLCVILRFMPTTKPLGTFPRQNPLHLLPGITMLASPHCVCCQLPSFGLFCHLYLQQPLWQMCQKTQQHLLYSFCFVLPNFFWPASMSQLLLQRSTKGTGSVASRTRVKSQFSHLLDVYVWANSWTSLSLSFLVYKMGVISPTLQDWCEMSREHFC